MSNEFPEILLFSCYSYAFLCCFYFLLFPVYLFYEFLEILFFLLLHFFLGMLFLLFLLFFIPCFFPFFTMFLPISRNLGMFVCCSYGSPMFLHSA